MKAALHFNNSKSMDKVIEWYDGNNWKESLELGQRLMQQVIKNDPKTPEGAVTTFADCLNLIYKDMFIFLFKGWEPKRKGEIDLKIAVIQIIPAKA